MIAPGTPNFVREGPIPRMMTRFASLPVMMKPPIMTLSPLFTRRRVEILTGCVAGLGDGDGLGLGEGLGLGDEPGLGEGLGLGDEPGLGDGLAVGKGVVLGDGLGLGDEFGLPTTVMVALTPLRASSIW